MEYIGTFRFRHAEPFRAQLDAAAEVLIALISRWNAFLRPARVEHLADDAEDRGEVVQVAATGIGQHHATRGVVDTLAIEQAQVGADLQDLEGRVRRQQRVEGGSRACSAVSDSSNMASKSSTSMTAGAGSWDRLTLVNEPDATVSEPRFLRW
jgi:hypothetical protein